MKKVDIIKCVCADLLDYNMIAGYAYDHFRQSEAVDPPFAVYRHSPADNFSADGVMYHRGENVDLELYAETPEDMACLMKVTESRLNSYEIYWECTADTVYIESEDFYETLYEV